MCTNNKLANPFKRILIYFGILFLIPAIFISSNCFILKTSIYGQSPQEELEQIKKEKEETIQKIEGVKNQESVYLKDVKAVEAELLNSLSQLGGLNEKLKDSKSDVDNTTIELVIMEQELKKIDAELAQKKSVLNNRVVSVYKHSNRNIFEVLLKSEDFIEFVSRLKLMTILASEDAAVVNEINDKKEANITLKKSIIDLREKQTRIKEEIEGVINQAEKKQREVEDLYDEKSNLLSKTRSDKNALLAIIKDFEIKEFEINRVLESYKYGNAPGNKFLLPIVGRKGSGFGWRIHPILGYKRFHSGIDFPASSGTPINSAEEGEVVSAGYDNGYGYSVMVYNGGGVATVYAHLSQILVAVGQRVEKGQVIGLVGSTGWATGPNLHFEVRVGGIAQNPLNWLP